MHRRTGQASSTMPQRHTIVLGTMISLAMAGFACKLLGLIATYSEASNAPASNCDHRFAR